MTKINQKKSKTSTAPKGGAKASDKQSKGASKQAPQKEKQGKKPISYEWQNFTKKSVAFNSSARELSEYVEVIYGTNISITQFEKFLLAYGNMNMEEKHGLFVEKKGIDLVITYQTAKDARDAERLSFRGDVAVADVQGTMAALASSFDGSATAGTKRLYEEEDDEDFEENEVGKVG